jgi:predicted RNase H-like nuclease (RuvC/YqgF family)
MYKNLGKNTTYKEFDESMGELFSSLEDMKSEIEKLEIKLQETKKLFDVADSFGRELFKEREEK